MQKPDYHILVCSSFRGAEIKGKCARREAMQLVPYFEEEIEDRGLNAIVTTTGCLNLCYEGPIVIVYPQGHWYSRVAGEEAADAILDAIEAGRPAEDYLLR